MQDENFLFYEQWQDLQKSAHKHDESLLLHSLQSLLQQDDGIRFLSWLLDITGVFAVSFTGNSATFFNEGKRSIGVQIYKQLMRADKHALLHLINFSLHKEKKHD